jgi:hypothetical protein
MNFSDKRQVLGGGIRIAWLLAMVRSALGTAYNMESVMEWAHCAVIAKICYQINTHLETSFLHQQISRSGFPHTLRSCTPLPHETGEPFKQLLGLLLKVCVSFPTTGRPLYPQ